MAGLYGLEIRAAVSTDAPGLADLMNAVGLSSNERSLGERMEHVRRQAGVVFVAVEWGPPSGLIHVTWRRTLDAPLPRGRIELLLVEPQARRRGLGRRLLKTGAQAARAAGCGFLELAVGEPCSDLSSFCVATGFNAEGGVLVRPLRKGA